MLNVPDGFRVVPGVPAYAVNEEGSVYSLRMGKLATISTQKSGYRTVAYADNGKTKTFYVHRLVAMAWLPLPEVLQGAGIVAEVNHDDGDKSNNKKSNLEWCSSKQNIKHAIDNGLLSFIKVRARNLLTRKELVFNHATDMARHFGINPKRLTLHLSSPMVGLLTKNHWVFNLDGEKWPTLLPEQIVENRWDEPRGLWVATNQNKQFIGSSLQVVCDGLGLVYSQVQPSVKADGETYSACGYEFHYSNLPTKQMMENAVYTDFVREFKKERQLSVTVVKPFPATTIYSSVRQAGKALELYDTTIMYAMRNRGGVFKDYIFKYLDEDDSKPESIVVRAKIPVAKEQRSVKVTIDYPWETSKVFNSNRRASRATRVSCANITKAMEENNGYHRYLKNGKDRHMRFEYV